MDHFVEAADWIVWQLTGDYVRNACTAGYKGIFQDGRYPDREFLAALNPDFAGFAEDKLAHRIGQLGDRRRARSRPRRPAWTGLPEGIAVAVGNVDAHVTAPAAQATEPGQMVAIMGTSTCHVMSHDALVEVPGHVRRRRRRDRRGPLRLRGRAVRGGRHLRLVRREPGARLVRRGRRGGRRVASTSTSRTWPTRSRSARTVSSRSTGTPATARCSSTTNCPESSSARPSRPGPSRATARCSRRRRSAPAMIVETFVDAGVPVTEFIVAGGLLSNPQLMQTYADVLRLPISTIASEQGPALGSAIHAAVAAGAYPDIRAAAAAMGALDRAVYTPERGRRRAPTTGSSREYLRAARLVRSRRQRRDEAAAVAAARGARDRAGRCHDHRRRRRPSRRRRATRSPRCTPSSCATGSSCGRAATCRAACRAPTCSSSSRPASPTTT